MYEHELQLQTQLAQQWEARAVDLSHELSNCEMQRDAERLAAQRVREENSGLLVRVQQVASLQQELAEQRRTSDELRNALASVQQLRVEAVTKLDVQQEAFERRERLLSESRQWFEREFQLIASRLLEEKTERIGQYNQQQVSELLVPLKDQLSDFRRKIEDTYDRESKDRAALQREILLLRDLNLRVSQDADNLVKALKGDNKVQGNWGELVLERVLSLSGLVKGREFDTQPTLTDTAGQRLRPDVIVHLPDGKHVVIDSKVSLLHWEAFVSAESEEAATAAMKQQIQSVRTHIRSLSGKAYEGLPGLQSLDFVLMFIPIEAAFLKLMELEQPLFAEASAKGLMLVCPSTLLTTLKTIQNLWRYEYQNRNAQQIAETAGGLHDQFALVVEAIFELGDRVERVNQSYDSLRKRMMEGRGNVLKRVSDLQALGAKTRKTLPVVAVSEPVVAVSEPVVAVSE
ncbi:DNA recombination protein RmuC homolog [gamma proteobacterium HdN1]|nr:DNA recombination protein RmuC homolog [gamma proteobacterium HdN1]